MKKNNLFICLLIDILDCAEKEKKQYLMGNCHCGIWNKYKKSLFRK